MAVEVQAVEAWAVEAWAVEARAALLIRRAASRYFLAIDR
jgi:hypothetical protein